ncbi:aspartyl-phosphate phosphatase Spo0E family protein [Caldibacillus lycopersici]|uniref:Aspartyl-phosphate phosphatase Spo0E family protein n=1 Tax=Perspicuibacillus lycopersici TaxID=1325689 RepID=A0AAE3LPF5_9BACI|nr:aspartyl-phosphate phosphatase Spo0E family protein [Perspicuibacillus lycopersici]MCU9612294.1 aspartyl-phosphate phosphatase Spo0E family protein [Perspicuibacillus lycopersici]
MKTERDIEEIKAAIKNKRELMIASAKTYGFTSEKTLRYSQELDLLINEYQRFFRKMELEKLPFFGYQTKEALRPGKLYA